MKAVFFGGGKTTSRGCHIPKAAAALKNGCRPFKAAVLNALLSCKIFCLLRFAAALLFKTAAAPGATKGCAGGQLFTGQIPG